MSRKENVKIKKGHEHGEFYREDFGCCHNAAHGCFCCRCSGFMCSCPCHREEKRKRKENLNQQTEEHLLTVPKETTKE